MGNGGENYTDGNWVYAGYGEYPGFPHGDYSKLVLNWDGKYNMPTPHEFFVR
jgi:hypothetical protein